MLKTFAHHTPSPHAVGIIRELRERSTAITHLESAAMWAIKGVVMTDPGAVVEGGQSVVKPRDS